MQFNKLHLIGRLQVEFTLRDPRLRGNRYISSCKYHMSELAILHGLLCLTLRYFKAVYDTDVNTYSSSAPRLPPATLIALRSLLSTSYKLTLRIYYR